MGFITDKKLAFVDSSNGLHIETFADYPSMVERLIHKLDRVQLQHLSKEIVPEAISRLEPEVSSAKPKTAAVSTQKISADFLRRIQNAGCQCGKQKLENYPLCGSCFTRLPPNLKAALRNLKGGELEAAYHECCDILKVFRKGKG